MHSQLAKATGYIFCVFSYLVGKRPQVKIFKSSQPLSSTAFSNHRMEYISKPLVERVCTIDLAFLGFNSKLLSKIVL